MNVFPSNLTYSYANECLNRQLPKVTVNQDILLMEARQKFVESIESGYKSHIQLNGNLTGESKLKLLKELAAIFPKVCCQFDGNITLMYPENFSLFPSSYESLVVFYPLLESDL